MFSVYYGPGIEVFWVVNSLISQLWPLHDKIGELNWVSSGLVLTRVTCPSTYPYQHYLTGKLHLQHDLVVDCSFLDCFVIGYSTYINMLVIKRHICLTGGKSHRMQEGWQAYIFKTQTRSKISLKNKNKNSLKILNLSTVPVGLSQGPSLKQFILTLLGFHPFSAFSRFRNANVRPQNSVGQPIAYLSF